MVTYFQVECFTTNNKNLSWKYENFGAARTIYEHLAKSDEFAYINRIILWCMQDDEAFLVYYYAKG